MGRRLVGDGSRGNLLGWRSTIFTVHSLLRCICPFPSFLSLILLGFGRGLLGFSVFFPPTCAESLSPRQGRASWRCSVSSGPACLLGSGAPPFARAARAARAEFAGMLVLRRQDSAKTGNSLVDYWSTIGLTNSQ